MILAFVFFLQVLAATSLGFFVLNVAFNPLPLTHSSVVRLTTGFVLGLGLLAHVYLLVGLAGAFKWQVISGINLVASVSGARHLWRERIPFGNLITKLGSEYGKLGFSWKLLSFLIALLVLAGMLSLGKSPIGDGAVFYLVLPKVLAASGYLVPLPHYEWFSSIGLQGEMHFAALMLLGSDDVARLFPWIVFLSAALLVGAVCGSLNGQNKGKREVQLLALAMLCTSSVNLLLLGNGKVDFFSAAYGTAAAYWTLFRKWNLTGCFLGLAIIGKFSYMVIFAPFLLTIMCWQAFFMMEKTAKYSSARYLVRSSASFASLLLLSLIPHFVKNGILFGNPLSPFFGSGVEWTKQVWFGPQTTRRIVLTYPFALTFGQFWAQYGDVSALVLGFLPFAVLLRRTGCLAKSQLTMFSFAALLGLFAWVFSNPSVLAPRYILAILWAFVPLAAIAAKEFLIGEKGFRVLRSVVMVGLLSFVTFSLSDLPTDGLSILATWKYLTHKISACERDGTYCIVTSAINRDAAPNARVFEFTTFTYWLRSDLIGQMATNEDYRIIEENAGELAWSEMIKRGFTYLLLDTTNDVNDLRGAQLFAPESIPKWIRLIPLKAEGPVSAFKIVDLRSPTGQI